MREEEEVKQYLFDRFLEWMRGQTIGINEDGSDYYYEWDVERYARWVGWQT